VHYSLSYQACWAEKGDLEDFYFFIEFSMKLEVDEAFDLKEDEELFLILFLPIPLLVIFFFFMIIPLA
jgi:hypothetical protein